MIDTVFPRFFIITWLLSPFCHESETILYVPFDSEDDAKLQHRDARENRLWWNKQRNQDSWQWGDNN